MTWREWLEKWDMSSLNIPAKISEIEWEPTESDKRAAWKLRIGKYPVNPSIAPD